MLWLFNTKYNYSNPGCNSFLKCISYSPHRRQWHFSQAREHQLILYRKPNEFCWASSNKHCWSWEFGVISIANPLLPHPLKGSCTLWLLTSACYTNNSPNHIRISCAVCSNSRFPRCQMLIWMHSNGNCFPEK